MTATTTDDSVVTPPPAVPAVDAAKKSVSHETYLKVLDEAKKAKEKLKVLEDEKATKAESDLKAQNEYKTLYEQTKTQKETLEKAIQEKDQAHTVGVKYVEFEKHLGGKLKKKEYFTHVDFDKIVVVPETGVVDEDSVKLAVSEFLKEHSDLVKFEGGGPTLPNKAGKSGAGGGKVTSKSVKEMTSQELQKYIKDQAAKGKLKG